MKLSRRTLVAALLAATALTSAATGATGASAHADTRSTTAGQVAAQPLDEAVAPASSAQASSALRNKIVSVARGEVTRKGGEPEDSHACNKYFEYTKVGHGSCQETSWCAAFAEWVWHKAGVKGVPDDTLAARGIGKWGVERGLFHRLGGYTPKPGDLMIYGEPDGHTPGHVGVVVAVHPNGTVDTVDGNYSDKVTLREDLKPSEVVVNHKDVSGFVSPPGA
ncbi:CHAP domain-containing protein [Streptomyces sp. 1331.2]|uniref:CHAP domain-containing protein n=1 Tax=Streptomyces sp. 1331.2 TaxID=1938835 RepID=UPI000BCC8CA9|nr:CHAP domain-containing protein [Streptomyces sp. 1331.2]SOB88464.1 CHAP domain-containing protein [Streptomyces sp. 1331.2]